MQAITNKPTNTKQIHKTRSSLLQAWVLCTVQEKRR